MRKSVVSIIIVAAVTCSAIAANSDNKPSPVLIKALKDIQQLNGSDMTALAHWIQGKGREDLRKRGVTDKQIGAARFDIDKFGDAALGK